jgi:hypothetical protein
MQPNKKIGIGISDPAYSLEIMGNDIAGGLAIYNSTSGTGTISDGFLVSLETDNEAFLWNFENGPINIGTNNLNRVKITANGDVGIGTDNPTENLDVNGNIKIEDGYLLFTRQNYISSIYTSGNNIGISNAAQGAIEFSTNPTQGTQILQAIIDKDGNFGIGTSSPERILHIRGSNPRILIEATSSNPEINFKSAGDAATDIWAIYKNSSTGDLHFYQNGNKLTLQKNTGNVGIGTTTPQGKLDVNGAIYQRGGVLHADYVFEDNYQLETIEEHAEFMWKNKHLPAIPKATVDANGLEIVEVGSHRKGIVEELEKAHIYISQLEKKINEQSAIIQDLKTNADNKELLKRIETLEKLILSRKN